MKGCKIHGHYVSFIQEPHPTEPVAQMEAQMETQVLICGLGMCSCLFCDTQCFLS